MPSITLQRLCNTTQRTKDSGEVEHNNSIRLYAVANTCAVFFAIGYAHVLFSVVSLCVSVCLSVCSFLNTITLDPFEISSQFLREQYIVRCSDEFESSCIIPNFQCTAAHGWWFLSPSLLLSSTTPSPIPSPTLSLLFCFSLSLFVRKIFQRT